MINGLMHWPASLRPKTTRMRRIEIGVFTGLLSMIFVWAWHYTPSALNLALFKQELHVALVSHPHDHTFTDLGNGPEHFELVLLSGLADRLGARLEVHRVSGPREAYRLLRAGRVDLAAGLLTVPGDDPGLTIGPEILPIQKQLVHWHGNGSGVGSLEELVQQGARIGVTSILALPKALAAVREHNGDGRGMELIQYADGPQLVTALRSGTVDYAVLTSIELSRLQRVHPALRASLELDGETPVVWLFPPRRDRSLVDSVQDYLEALRAGREFELLFDRHFGHLEVHDLVDVISFTRFMQERLGPLRPLFEEIAQEHGLDWRFLAAVSYQESHWDPGAVSPTGVRGLMMLTNATARSLGVSDRTDPRQSVEGGARYMLQMLQRLPEEISEPDRTWMALASYNVGLGHLLDARHLTEADGGDPNLWLDVMDWLPRLAQREWHEQTRYGYARGWEPVTYVQNIRSYYDWLVQLFPEPADRDPGTRLYLSTPLSL
ncbi:MAG: membrane-bound lytic murein transglycosylase MltF [Thioalkalivibrio sp.]|nr:MAG: membrane-bound lytic murein transglycosylase MltF [Thioalkalivibrio sp.]